MGKKKSQNQNQENGAAASAAPAAKPEAPKEPKAPKEKKPQEPIGPPPDLRFMARGRGMVQGYSGPDWKEVEGCSLPPSDEVEICYSQDGALLVAVDHESGCVNICDSLTAEIKVSIKEPKVLYTYISPRSTYLVTFRRYEKDDVPNLTVWDVATGNEVTKMLQSRWPALTWSMDEAICIRMMNNGLQALNGTTLMFEKENAKLDNPKIEAISVSPNLPPYVAVFQRQLKGEAGFVKLYKAPNLQDEILHKSMFKADSADIYWNTPGTGCIVNCKTDSDSTGKSYYGESMVFLMLPKSKETMNVMVGKSGERVHDVAWAPNGSEFIMIYGAMPMNKATLFNIKAEPVFEFGTNPKNTVSWSPNSRFVALCGFGNLAGEMQFWDRRKVEKGNGKMAIAGMNGVTSYCWTPDSRYFVCSVTAPRMKVGNKITIFKHNGEEMFSTPFPKELYQVIMKPEKAKMFPNRDPSPPPKGEDGKAVAKPAAPALFQARGSAGVSAMLRKEREGGYSGSSPGAIKPVVEGSYIPGMAPPKPAAKKGKGGKK